jgi:hypothetical protein
VLRGGYAIDMLRGLAEKRSREPIASIRLLSAGCRRHLLTLRFNSSHPWMLWTLVGAWASKVEQTRLFLLQIHEKEQALARGSGWMLYDPGIPFSKYFPFGVCKFHVWSNSYSRPATL